MDPLQEAPLEAMPEIIRRAARAQTPRLGEEAIAHRRRQMILAAEEAGISEAELRHAAQRLMDERQLRRRGIGLGALAAIGLLLTLPAAMRLQRSEPVAALPAPVQTPKVVQLEVSEMEFVQPTPAGENRWVMSSISPPIRMNPVTIIVKDGVSVVQQ